MTFLEANKIIDAFNAMTGSEVFLRLYFTDGSTYIATGIDIAKDYEQCIILRIKGLTEKQLLQYLQKHFL